MYVLTTTIFVLRLPTGGAKKVEGEDWLGGVFRGGERRGGGGRVGIFTMCVKYQQMPFM